MTLKIWIGYLSDYDNNLNIVREPSGTETAIFWDNQASSMHDDCIKWKHSPHYWPFGRIMHRSPVNSPHKSHWHAALRISLIFVWTNCWVNNRAAVDLRRHRTHYDVIGMWLLVSSVVRSLEWPGLLCLPWKRISNTLSSRCRVVV